MSAHTPGPWTVLLSNVTPGWYQVVRQGGDVAENVCEEANARLIAAAPELLAALYATVPLMVKLGDFIGNDLGRCEAILAAREAMAKATGLEGHREPSHA